MAASARCATAIVAPSALASVPSSSKSAPAGLEKSCLSRKPLFPSSSGMLDTTHPSRLIVHRRSGNGPSFVSDLRSLVDQRLKDLQNNALVKQAAIWAMNAALVLPALAEEEKGKIFDFNLTLPIIAAEFLLLMVALDNIWFKPVGKIMDERDESIRQKLLGVRDNSEEIKKLQEQAEAIIKAARAETTAALNKMKKETAAELDAQLQKSRAKIEEELAQALSNLEQKKQETMQSLDKQVQELSDEILKKVIPFKI